jgi:hypothetical protein
MPPSLFSLVLGLVVPVLLLVLASRSYAEQDRIESGNPWGLVWLRPRAAVRIVLERGGSGHVLPLVALNGVVASLYEAGATGRGEEVALGGILAAAIIAGPLWALIGFFVTSFFTGVVGRMLGGVARAREVRSALAFALVVSIAWGSLEVPAILLAGQERFMEETPVVDASAALTWSLAVLDGLMLGGFLWAIVASVLAVAEAHRFEGGKGLVALAVGSVLFLALVFLPLLALYAALVAFG